MAPFRRESGAGDGVKRWSHLHILLPQLGMYAKSPTLLGYDLNTLYAMPAPKPVLVVSPQLDWEAPVAKVTRCVESARKLYAQFGAEDRLAHLTPEDYNHFDANAQARVIDWLLNQR